MADFVIVSGDMALFLPNFGQAVVVPVMPGTMISSAAKSNAFKKPACLAGDEKKVMVPGCPYITPSHPIPGVGTLKIQKVETAKKTKAEGKALILKGQQFEAVFEVNTPAQMPPPASTPDPTPKYPGGKGMFITTNLTVRAT